MNLEAYKSYFLTYLSNEILESNKYKTPVHLYDPIHYILQLGGKRIRPILTLMSCQMFNGKIEKALPASLAIEMFHNFTLIHDDIMDKAFLRRGKPTVHKKWNENIGILSGDALLILSHQMLEKYKHKKYKELASIFNRTALKICEGQQLDMDFEQRNDVTISEYLTMIKYKTAVLLACSLQMGAIIADASEQDATQLYNFGLFLGIAFQLQDDYLDAFGDDTIGKKIGGDIAENKKTFLIIKTLELASEKDKTILLELFSNTHKDKIELVKNLIVKYQVDKLVKTEIEYYTNKAINQVENLNIDKQKKKDLINFGLNLMKRNL